MVSELPNDTEGTRYEPPRTTRATQRHWLEDSQGESRRQLAHSSNTFVGDSQRDPRAHNGQAFRESIRQREANKWSATTGNTVHALIRRENQNDTLQPMYPNSIINDAFNRHTIAKTIDFKGRPRPENDQPAGTRRTQKTFLPYERTRASFPMAARSKGPSSAPFWWPKTPLAPPSIGNSSSRHESRGITATAAAIPSGGPGQQSSGAPLPRTPPGYLTSARTGKPIHMYNYVN